MFFAAEISFKNLAMEKVSSPFINNVLRACTILSLVTAASLLLYLNQGNHEFIRDSLKPADGASTSISSVQVFPASRTEDEKNGTLEGPLAAEKNESLWEPSETEKNVTSEHPSAIDKNETSEELPQVENEALEELPQVEIEALEDSPQVKNETSEDLPQVENEALEDLPQVKKETLVDWLEDTNQALEDSPQVKNETLVDWLEDTNQTLEGSLQLKDETSENSLLFKNETLDDSSQAKNDTLEGSLQVKNETLEELPQAKNETLKEDNGIVTKDNGTTGEDNYCNIFDGNWVYDPTISPMYEAADCPFLSDQVDCRRNGRPDSNYERWSWEGSHCEIPRMNRTDMLERLRGKRVIIVGDSLNRNQFESLVCLLYSSIPSWDSYVDVQSGSYKIFRSKSYRCTVEFFWAPFLVEMEQKVQDGTRILKLDQINPSAKKWKGANVMIFNTGHWWVHLGKLKAWDMIRYKGKFVENMELQSAFEKGIKTWSRWVDRNVDPAQTTVFFRSISPEHKGINWCYEPTEPLMDGSYINIFPSSVRTSIERRIRRMRTPVRYLNITRLAEYRIDAHPKIYTIKYGALLTMDQRKQPEIYSDCSHWCIPGVPDTWNRLVYASLVLDGFGANSTSLMTTLSSR